VPVALLTLNVGVELGQLLFRRLAWARGSIALAAWTGVVPSHAIGTVAVFWRSRPSTRSMSCGLALPQWIGQESQGDHVVALDVAQPFGGTITCHPA